MTYSNIEPTAKIGVLPNGEELHVYPERRTMGTLVIGSVGTGRNAGYTLPIINQDLQKIALSKPSDVCSEQLDPKQILTGLTIIDSNHHNFEQILHLAKMNKVPNQRITYINPYDTTTPSLNLMNQDAETIYQVLKLIISEYMGPVDTFFEQKGFQHLKNYVYLLKYHAQERDVTFDMLLNMYNDPSVVREMYFRLKDQLQDQTILLSDQDKKTIEGTGYWFGDDLYSDDSYTLGLKNVLNHIGANTLLKNVLLKKSNFIFKHHYDTGGLLLVNTDRERFPEESRMIGLAVLKMLEIAVTHREKPATFYHHVWIEDASNHLSKDFLELAAVSRLYRLIITVVDQTLSQVEKKFGSNFTMTLVNLFRNHILFGDLSISDEKLFLDFRNSNHDDESFRAVITTRQGEKKVYKDIKIPFIPKEFIYEKNTLVES